MPLPLPHPIDDLLEIPHASLSFCMATPHCREHLATLLWSVTGSPYERFNRGVIRYREALPGAFDDFVAIADDPTVNASCRADARTFLDLIEGFTVVDNHDSLPHFQYFVVQDDA